ncbi:MAG: alpha/beta hydrolase [Candidatus Binatia bacterium]|nr:MAG: alpha/beta hydrolase [Candidatus Binatia bacterium]
MTALLWLLALLSAGLTYNVWRPSYRPGRRAVLSFFAGWLTDELALHHIAVQFVLALLLIGHGAAHHALGTIALGVLIVSWWGLWVAYWKGDRAGETVEYALREALGADYRRHVRPEIRQAWEEGTDWKAIAIPFPIRHPEVERHRDILYRRVGGINLRLDVYRHRSRPENCPVLLQIHGGGWVIGSKNEQGLPLMMYMAARGWVCVSVDYRLSPHATFPDHLVDVKAALVWVREHASEYGADPNFVVVTGGSAGGHLAALVALTANDPAYQPGFEQKDTRVQGAVTMYGVYDFVDRFRTFHNPDIHNLLETKVMKASIEEAPEAYEKASPIALVRPDAPPFMVVHGDHDTLVPVEQARHFVAALRAVSRNPVVYAEIPGAQHAFDIFPSLRCLHVIHGIGRFLGYVYSKHLEQRERGAA